MLRKLVAAQRNTSTLCKRCTNNLFNHYPKSTTIQRQFKHDDAKKKLLGTQKLQHEAFEYHEKQPHQQPESTTSNVEDANKAIEPRLGIMFTCNKCQTRSFKTFSKHSYEKGVVIVDCDGCKSHHLMADHLGWFQDETKNVEEFLAAKGQKVTKVTTEQLQDALKKM